MSSGEHVQFSGACLASMVHCAASEVHDMEGLLVGSLKTHQQGEVEDSFEARSKTMSTFYITGALPTTGTFSFYNNQGIVNENLVKQIGNGYEVIGWFKCRRNSPLHPSMYEHYVHASLAEKLGKKPEDIVYALFVASHEKIHVHEFKYSCWRMNNRKFHPLSGNVTNLGGDGAEKPAYSAAGDVYDMSESTMNIVGPLGSSDPRSDLVKTVEGSYQQVLNRIQVLGKDIASSDRLIQQEQRKLAELQIRFREKAKQQKELQRKQQQHQQQQQKQQQQHSPEQQTGNPVDRNPFKLGKSQSMSPTTKTSTNPFAATLDEPPRSKSETPTSSLDQSVEL